MNDWYHKYSTNAGKALEFRGKFAETDEHRVQVNEAKIDGLGKYRVGGTLSGDITQINNEYILVERDYDDEGDKLDADYVVFGIDRPTWKWVVGLYWKIVMCGLRVFLIAQVV